MRNFLILALLGLCAAAAGATEAVQNFDTSCGGENFRIAMTYTNTPGVRRYVLTTLPKSGAPRVIYRGEEGGVFQAACLDSSKNGKVIVFRSHCRATSPGCVVSNKFGVVEAASQEIILRPRPTNTPNERQVAEILGRSVPNLALTPGFFCCRD